MPLPALLGTSSVSALCFGSSFVGRGALWGWLQNFVGVSNQVCFVVIFLLGGGSVGLMSGRLRGCRLASRRGGSGRRGCSRDDRSKS